MSLGVCGSGMHEFILDEAELGERAAMALDDEQIWGASAVLWFADLEQKEGAR